MNSFLKFGGRGRSKSKSKRKSKSKVELYCDLKFPPNVSSLYNPSHPVATDRSKMDKYRWLRPNIIFHKQEYHVFTDGVEPNDIIQGDLGDCYFLSALSALAEFPKRITHAFVTKDISPDGKYEIEFCICGEAVRVVIDDYFPCEESTDSPCFSHAHGNEMWVMLLEKAWAKVNGSYENIVKGDCYEALRAITGAPCKRVSHKGGMQEYKGSELDDIWNQIESSDQLNYVMCSNVGRSGDGSKDGSFDEKFKEMGLISSHAYALIEAHTVSVGSKKVRLLKLRNPWGGTEWKGDWSDESTKWTPELKKKLDWKDEDDGTFWIDYEDFITYFEYTTICKMDESFVRTHLNVEHEPGKFTIVTCELKEDLDLLFFTVSQLGTRYADSDSHEPSASQVILGRLTDKTADSGHPVDFVKAIYDTREDVTLEVTNVSAGKYIIFVQNDCKEFHHFFLDSYAKAETKLEIIPDPFGGKFLELILSSCAREQKMMTYERSGQPDIKRFACLNETNSGYGCIYYQNDSEFCTLKEEVTFKKFEGLSLFPPYSGSSYEVTVPPHSTKAVVFKRDNSLAVSQLSVKGIPKFEFPNEGKELIKMVQSKGKKNAVTYNGKTYDIFWYFTAENFLFVNETKEDCRVIFKFTIENEDPVTWDFRLSCGEQVLKDKPKGSFKYTYGFVVTQDIESVDDVPRMIREKGKKGQAGSLEIYYYYLQHGNNYLWLFDSEDSKGYKLTCNFKLTNLALDDELEGAGSWTVELPPGAHIMRKMTIIESKPFNFDLSMSVAGL